MEFVIILAIPFLLALLLPFLCRYIGARRQSWLLFAVMSGLFVALLSRLPRVVALTAISLSVPWVPEIGLAFSLYIDGLSLLFAVLITGIGALVLLYAGYYFDEARQVGRFHAFLLVFIGSMLLLVMAGNLIVLFIAWELTSVTSFLLISFKSSDAQARAGASQALIVTVGGGLALLLGLLMMGDAAGTMSLGEILSSGDLLRSHPWYSAFTILIMIGCFAKSAQFPLHFWLPGAMAAPTPASAFLHSATMVKAGIYLLARLYPVLGDTPLWTYSLTVVGLATMLIAAILALRQRDLKGILAYT
ncbi:MAG TPA: proton-conducting transporter membrane subunit, partial [Bellilinea sp.]|nr:proton-conducting transporter membrane subunit [Bellilinea sp.]